MPRDWYDRLANKLPENYTEEDEKKRAFNLRIVADKKPYFMRYIYPLLMNQYNTYMKNTRVKCVREFRVELPELLVTPEEDLTEDQKVFLKHYHGRMPVSTNDCVMNRICRIFEREFDGYLKQSYTSDAFDSGIMKSGTEYSKRQYLAVTKLYQQYTEDLVSYNQKVSKQGIVDSDERRCHANNLKRVFREECTKTYTNGKQLCDLVIDLCYSRAGTRQFAWDICSDEILHNLLEKNDFMITYPVQDDDGDVFYGGKTFKMIRRRSSYEGDCVERETESAGSD